MYKTRGFSERVLKKFTREYVFSGREWKETGLKLRKR